MVNRKTKILIFFSSLLILACNVSNEMQSNESTDSIIVSTDTTMVKTEDKQELITTNMINVMDSISEAEFDIRYADTNNFVHRKMYPCRSCYLRPEAYKALKQVSENAHKMGFKLLIYDCFRPLEVQKMLWEIMPNPIYVTPPTTGSQHNRGLAVDLTLADLNGKAIDMGSPYDDFSNKSHWSYKAISSQQLSNRLALKTLMKTQGFDTINSEWWHYSYNKASYPIENEVWKCK